MLKSTWDSVIWKEMEELKMKKEVLIFFWKHLKKIQQLNAD